MSDTTGRILIVDDDHDFSESTATYLRAHGLDVVQAYDGQEGLKAARLHRPDLILMDIMMEERTAGLFTVQQLRRDPVLRDVPIIVMSSLYSDVPGFRIESDPGWMGHDEFLPKPVDLDHLLDRIQARLEAGANATSRSTEGAP